MSTFEKVKGLLVEQLSVDEDQVTMDSEFVADLGSDSLDQFEMLVTMEEEFEISLPDEQAKNLKTVGDLVKFIDENK